VNAGSSNHAEHLASYTVRAPDRVIDDDTGSFEN
jgi:hypothetical protein